MFGNAQENGAATQRIYMEIFPSSNSPDCQTFDDLPLRLYRTEIYRRDSAVEETLLCTV